MKTKSRTKRFQASRSTTSARTRRRSTVLLPASFRIKRILVTTDFSKESKKALPYAAAFAKRLGSEVALLNVLDRPSGFAGFESVVLPQVGDAAIGRVYQGLDALAQQAFTSQVSVKTYVRTGKPYREIVKAARELDVDLIIMATHGYTGLNHTFLGSTTERVVRHAPCPVLAVRGAKDTASEKPQRGVTVRRIVVATDFSDNSLKAFPLAQTLATGFGASITLMYVVERFPIDAILGEEMTRDTSTRLMQAARARLSELAKSLREKSGVEIDLAVRFGTPFAEITRVAKALDASLIVLATHGYTGLKHIYLGSVAERVMRHAHCPVLVTREAPR